MLNLPSLDLIPLRSSSLHLRPESAELDSAEIKNSIPLRSSSLRLRPESVDFDFAELESAEISLNSSLLNFARQKRWRVVVWFAALASGVC